MVIKMPIIFTLYAHTTPHHHRKTFKSLIQNLPASFSIFSYSRRRKATIAVTHYIQAIFIVRDSPGPEKQSMKIYLINIQTFKNGTQSTCESYTLSFLL